ncbi:MAG: ABC transporter permease [Akkermansia sp.]
MLRRLTTPLFFVLVLLLWQLITQWQPVPTYLFPPPGDVVGYLWGSLSDGTLGTAVLVTLRRLISGYAVGVLLGVPLGMLCAHVRPVRQTLGLTALGLQGLPSVCWVPMATLWFGQTESALLFVVIMGTLWSVILAVQNGMEHIPPSLQRASYTMGNSPWETLVLVTLPAGAPHILSGLKQGWAFAWRSLMSAEIFVPIITGFGLGQLLHYGRELSSMDQVMGIMLVILLIGLLTDKLLFSPLENHLRRTRGLTPS